MFVSLHPFAGQGDTEGAAEALAEDIERVFTIGAALGQPAQSGFHVVQCAFDIGGAGGLAVTAIIDGEHVVALFRQPGGVEDVGADVLGVAVQEVDGALGGLVGEGREPPAVEGFAVRGLEVDVFVFQVESVRGDVSGIVRIEEHAAASGLQQRGDGQQGDESRFGIQK